MRNILFATLLLVACENAPNTTSTGQDDTLVNDVDTTGYSRLMNLKYGEPIDSTDAKEIIKKLKRLKVDKDDIAYSLFDLDDMRSIVKDSSANKLRFFVGGFPKMIEGRYKLIPVVVIQAKFIDKSTLAESNAYYLGDPNICPPPEGTCDESISNF